MFGRHADRLAEPQRIGLQHPGIGSTALGLVGGDKDVIRPLAQDLGEHFVKRRHPGPRVDQEQAHIGHVHRPLGQLAHPALEAVVGGILQPRGVDHRESQVGQPRIAFPQVARHARLVVDQRQPLAHKPVEQRGFAHVGAAHDCQCETHLVRLRIG